MTTAEFVLIACLIVGGAAAIFPALAISRESSGFQMRELARLTAALTQARMAGRPLDRAPFDQQQAVLFSLAPELLRQIQNGTTQERLAALSLFSNANNSSYLTNGRAPLGGNCFCSTLSTIYSVGTGNLTQPMGYSDAQYERTINALRTGADPSGVQFNGQIVSGTMAGLEATARTALTEGQMAYLYSGQTGSAHATVVVKLEGNLYVINHQGWNPPSQTLSQWDAQWRNSGVLTGYTLEPTNVVLNRVPPR